MSEAIASLLSTTSDTARMRLLAGNGDENVDSEVLQQFEALFLQQMLKSMRTASLGDGLLQSDQTEFYRDMYDQQIATDLAKQEVLGISQLINKQLSLNESNAANVEGTLVDSPFSANTGYEKISAVNLQSNNKIEKDIALPVVGQIDAPTIFEKKSSIDGLSEIRLQPFAAIQNNSKPLAFKPDSPEDFVDYAYEFSIPAAKRLGVDANVIIAIAALETGWGSHLPSNGDEVSNNYFGIKADSRWQGHAIDSETLEFENGVFNKLKQSFRAYQDLGDSFNDFADFLLGNERYARALEFAHDAKHFLQEIQKAGYATDPKYADKVLNVLNSQAFFGSRQ